jgi:hypothetical protein
MTQSEREAFVKSLSTGIGGSSIASLLQPYIPVEYGCQRKLWYRLSGVEPNYPELETEPMALGTILEAPVATAYSNLTGRKLEEVGLKKHVEHESLQVHIDRLIHPVVGDSHDTQGVYEGKAVGDEMFRKVSDTGLPADYLLQGQHGVLCHDLSWGAFAVGRRSQFAPYYLIQVMAKIDGRTPPPLKEPRPIYFEFERDKGICDAILRVGPEFWLTLKDESKIPDRLEPDDHRCEGCGWRLQCQGAALLESVSPEDNPKKPPLMDGLGPLIAELRERHVAVLKAIEDEEETEQVIKMMLRDKQAVSVMVPDEDGELKRKNLIYRIRQGTRRLKGERIAPSYTLLRNLAIENKWPGAELTPALEGCYEAGMPSRPLLTAYVLPKKKKKVVGELDSVTEEEG